MKVLLHYDAGPAWRRDVAELGARGLDVTCCGEQDDELFYKLLPDAEVIWHLLRPISASDIAKAKKLQLIQKIGVGVNTIDLEVAKARGIVVCNMPGTNARAVAEMALLLMLACLRRLAVLDPATRQGRGWSLGSELQDHFGELGGRTVGLVGFGGIPQILCPVLTALGARVLYTDIAAKSGVAATFRPLRDLFHESDIISLHTPLTAETNRFVNHDLLAVTKPGAILINTARGGLVDQEALVEALRAGRLGAAGLDVFAAEPVSADDPLFKLENVVVTPHLSWLTAETLNRSLGIAADNCRRLSSGEAFLHRVV